MPTFPEDKGFMENQYKRANWAKYLIVKGNQIVQRTHYSMPLADQKVLASLIRSIKPYQQSLTIHFSTKEFMHMTGMRKSGTAFAEVMNALRNISNDNFYIKRPDGKYALWQWLNVNGVVADPNGKNSGDFIVRFNPHLKQYLLNQSVRYHTIYRFSDIMLMKSRYSPRLYEIFRSNQSRQKVQKRGLNYSLDELHYSLNLMHRNRQTNKIKHDKNGHVKYVYPAYSDFRRRVLEPALKEINKLTEYNLKMRPLHGKNRKTIGINVVMTKKNKEQTRKRDDLIYCITHHIPKSEWKTWREDTIRGHFHKVHGYNKKSSKVINGKFHVVNNDSNTKFSKYLLKHPIPMKIVNMGGDKVCYYSPFIYKYIWTTRKIYDKQQEVIKELNGKK